MVKRRETLSGYRDEDSDDSRSAAQPEGGRYSASRVTKVLVSRRAARIRAPGRGFRGRPTHGTMAGAYCQLWRCVKEKPAVKKADVDQGGMHCSRHRSTLCALRRGWYRMPVFGDASLSTTCTMSKELHIAEG